MKKADVTLLNHPLRWPGGKIISPRITSLAKSRSSAVLSIALLALVLFFVLLLNIWIHTKIVDVGYRIGDLTHQKKILITRYKNLNIEHASVLSDKNLQKIARKRFHLSPLTLEQVINIDEKD